MEILAWPAVGLILSIVALFALRAPLVRLIDRVSRAGKDGLTFGRGQDSKEPQQPALPLQELMNLPVSSSVLAREKAIQGQLQNFALKNDTEKVAVLTRSLATTRLDLEYNILSRVIFGSQLNFLVQLAGTGSGLPKSAAESQFLQAQTNFENLHKGRTVDEWLKYLTLHSLVSVANNQIDITQYGTDFLKFLVDARQAYDRYG